MHEPVLTLVIIIATVVVSALGFRDERVVRRYLFDVQAVRAGQYLRLFTAGFLHSVFLGTILIRNDLDRGTLGLILTKPTG